MPLSAFHPSVAAWFRERLGEPSPVQERGWPAIRAGGHVLLAAPTGSGKTLAAFLQALDALLQEGACLPDETRVLYVSPLKALGNDVAKNLLAPLREIRERDQSLPELRVLVRTGDTPARERAAMQRRAPHVLVTTPESLFLMLGSAGGRALLRTVRTAIVDEIHAVLPDKRGDHLALSLERLEALAGPLQRIGLSATQRPLERTAAYLAGSARSATIVDASVARALDLAIELPSSELATVCSHEVWAEIYHRIAALARERRSTLVFVNTRKTAERVSRQLGALLGAELVGCHHSSLARERRLEAEEKLKAGALRALVATASLELGLDIGDVDLVVQVGSVRTIATFLQRVGRAGHGVGRIPVGRLFPLTRDELAESAALFHAVRAGDLDETRAPRGGLDVLAQQLVAACEQRPWTKDELHALVRAAWPYRELAREEFDATVALHTQGREALLHEDGVNGILRATRRARLVALMNGGAIPDNADYKVVLDPEGTTLGSVNEDFAVEASAGDVFQLGASSWRILRVRQGEMRVADAAGAPPSLPFWFGEAPARTPELSEHLGEVREHALVSRWLEDACGFSAGAADQLRAYLESARAALGELPTPRRVIAERFFDETGGMQLVLHAPFGARINRAWGLALRKRFCRGFGFELQAAANEDAIAISLGPQHSFPLEEVFDFLSPATARELLVQAVLATPLFATRWRWNTSRALLVERRRNGQRVPSPIQRMRAEDLLVRCFPDVVACPETLAGPNLEVPWEHPLVRQTLRDCLEEALDVEGFLAVLRGLKEGGIERRAIDTSAPSPLALGVLSAAPYAFLDDAPLEERRTQAVLGRRGAAADLGALGELDAAAVERVRAEAWPEPRDVEEVHEALRWMGFVESGEAPSWRPWLEELLAAGRAVADSGRIYAAESSREPRELWRGRLEALPYVETADPALFELEREGCALRARFQGREVWCGRRLLQRIRRLTLEDLRARIQPVSPAEFERFRARWDHSAEGHRVEGPRGVIQVLRRLAGREHPLASWESELLPQRVEGYQRDWLDQALFSGELAFGRLHGSSSLAPRATPIAFFPREEFEWWLALAAPLDLGELGHRAHAVLDVLRTRGASFLQELARAAKLLPNEVELALAELLSRGAASCDGFQTLRGMLKAPSQRKHLLPSAGRWALFRASEPIAPPPEPAALAEFVARQLLERSGVVFRMTYREERFPLTWREVLLALRRLELRGEVRGGRFVAGTDGEQYARPDAVEALRRRSSPTAPRA